MSYSAYVLSSASRAALLEKFPPQFERVVAHHVTHEFPSDEAPPAASDVKVIGHAADDGVEALVVSVDGERRRPDGKLYHITWSLAEGRKPVHSNELLTGRRYTLTMPKSIEVTPEVVK